MSQDGDVGCCVTVFEDNISRFSNRQRINTLDRNRRWQNTVPGKARLMKHVDGDGSVCEAMPNTSGHHRRQNVTVHLLYRQYRVVLELVSCAVVASLGWSAVDHRCR